MKVIIPIIEVIIPIIEVIIPMIEVIIPMITTSISLMSMISAPMIWYNYFSRRLFITTATELKAIAALAIIGLSNIPKAG